MLKPQPALPILFCLFLACSAPAQKPLSTRPQIPTGKLIAAREMTTARGRHTATILPDFKVLIAGGNDQHGVVLATTEIYDPTTETFSPAAKMTVPREGHVAGSLSDGKVLIAGGATHGGMALSSCEDYDYETGKFTPRGNMHARRVHAVATVLRDGRILVTGGEDGTQVLDSAESYDVLNGKWTLVGKMTSPRVHHTATLLADGRVLIAGGVGSHNVALATAEIFDPKTNKFMPTASLHGARLSHTSALLTNGAVLIAGGFAIADHDALVSAEIYKPQTASFTPTGNLAEPHVKLPDSTALLDGRVLIIGGAATAEIYDPKSGTFRTAEGSLDTARYDSAALQLMDGSTRLFGGIRFQGRKYRQDLDLSALVSTNKNRAQASSPGPALLPNDSNYWPVPVMVTIWGP